MRTPDFYLGEAEFTKQDRSIVHEFRSKYPTNNKIKGIVDANDYIKYLYSRSTHLIEEQFSKKERRGLKKELDKLWRKRTTYQILHECFEYNGKSIGGFLTGCTDAALVFVTLARIEGVPVAYVEAIEEKYLRNPFLRSFPFLRYATKIQGHVFVDVYHNDGWIPVNPGYGRTVKKGKIYSWSIDEPERKYIELARGLDFSHLYTDEEPDKPIELKTRKQILELIMKSKFE